MTWRDVKSDPPPRDGTTVRLGRMSLDGSIGFIDGWWHDADDTDRDDDDGWVIGPTRKVRGDFFSHWQPIPPEAS